MLLIIGMFVPVSISLMVGVVAMWRRHSLPTLWQRRRYALFLRRFDGVSSTAAIEPVTKGLPSDVAVVFLSAPAQQVRSFDPATLALAGLRLHRPFASVPVYLWSDGSAWNDDVMRLAKQAWLVVIDVSDASEAMEHEEAIVRALGARTKVLWLCRERARRSVSMPEVQRDDANQAILYYRETKLGALWSTVVSFVMFTWAAFALPNLIGIVIFVLGDWELDPLVDVQNWLAGLAVLLGLSLTYRVAPRKGYARGSSRDVREVLARLSRNDPGSSDAA